MSTVAVVGLGAMGRALVTRLLGTGHEVVVWNRSPEPVEAAVGDGAVALPTAAAAAGRAEFTITMIADPAALRAVTEGPDGVLAGAAAGSALLQMATVGPAPVLALAERMPAGVDLVDCPVLGSISETTEGTLSVFVGGDPERAAPVLSSLGRIVPVGPIGAGSAAKLVANSTLFGVLGLLGEAIALGDGLGLARESTWEVLGASPLGAQAERRREPFETGEAPLRFELALAGKDADLVVGAATDAGLSLRLAAAAQAWIADAIADGLGEEDYSAILTHIVRRASG